MRKRAWLPDQLLRDREPGDPQYQPERRTGRTPGDAGLTANYGECHILAPRGECGIHCRAAQIAMDNGRILSILYVYDSQLRSDASLYGVKICGGDVPTCRQSAVAVVLRRYPLLSGCDAIANHDVVRHLAGSSAEVAWAAVHGGYLVAAPLDDYVGRAAFYAGDLDRKITWVCRQLVRPGDQVLDIGANLGLVSMILARLVGPTGRVDAFEPNPVMCDLIERAIDRNGVRNVRLHRTALGAEAGELTLSVPRGHAGAASFLPELRYAEQDGMTVPVGTLSEIMSHSTDRARLVKIDVEGFEPQVLAGAADYFDRLPPETVLFELYDRNPVNHPTVRFHLDRGYRIFAIPRALMWLRLRPLDGRIRCHDYLAVHPDVPLEPRLCA